jgi:hypothetical protein
MSRISAAVAALAVVGGLASVSTEAAQRAFVSFNGSDANLAAGCLLANPCRTFATAHTAVDAGGEIIALDAGGYGPVTITKSVTITANPGFFAGIAASAGNAVTINTAAVNVVLRGLNINGIGATHGVSATLGARLNVENCVISGFTGQGIQVGDVGRLRVVNTLIRGNGGIGILVLNNVAGDVSGTQVLDNTSLGIWLQGASTLSITDSVLSGNAWGLGTSAGTASVIRTTASGNASSGIEVQGGTVSVGHSQASNNGVYGLNNVGGTLRSLGNNVAVGNGTAATGGVITADGGV